MRSPRCSRLPSVRYSRASCENTLRAVLQTRGVTHFPERERERDALPLVSFSISHSPKKYFPACFGGEERRLKQEAPVFFGRVGETKKTNDRRSHRAPCLVRQTRRGPSLLQVFIALGLMEFARVCNVARLHRKERAAVGRGVWQAGNSARCLLWMFVTQRAEADVSHARARSTKSRKTERRDGSLPHETPERSTAKSHF